MPNEFISPSIKILITGEKPGCGSTTLAKNLEAFLDFTRLSGGYTRRAQAFHWHDFNNSHFDTSEKQTWEAFTNLYQLAEKTHGHDGIVALLKPYYGKPDNTKILQEFNACQKQHSAEDIFWDAFIDKDLYVYTFGTQNNVILESKLAVVLREIEEFIQLGVEQPSIAPIIINILLSVSDQTAAQRMSEREKTTFTATDVVSRLENDWLRYINAYHHNSGRPLSHTDIYTHSYKIETDAISAAEVMSIALLYIHSCLATNTQYEPIQKITAKIDEYLVQEATLIK